MGGDTVKHPPIQDWKTFKVENAPELVKIQKELASYGLKDPWARNEVWRYDRKTFGTKWDRSMKFFFRGFKWGLVLAVTHVAVKTVLSKGDEADGHH